MISFFGSGFPDWLCQSGWFCSRLLHRFALAIGPSGLVAVLAGWVTTEVGRQPWTIYGLMRTADSASPLAAPAVAASLVAFVLIYFSVFGAGIVYIHQTDGQAARIARVTAAQHAGALCGYHSDGGGHA